MKKILIAPSTLAADLGNLASEIKRVEAAGADLIHVDVMDGHFVDNITIGPATVQAIRKVTKLPLDVHLMIDDPLKHVDEFLNAGADIVTFHLESVALTHAKKRTQKGYTVIFFDNSIDFDTAGKITDRVKSRGKKVGIAINPDTIPEIMEGLVNLVDMVLVMTVWPGFGGQGFIADAAAKIHKVRSLNKNLDIEVDGGINLDTVSLVAREGANIIVAGTATFRAPDVRYAIQELRRRAESIYPK